MKITYTTYMANLRQAAFQVYFIFIYLFIYLFIHLFIYLFIYFLEWAEHVNTGNVRTVAASGKKELRIQKVSGYVWADPRE